MKNREPVPDKRSEKNTAVTAMGRKTNPATKVRAKDVPQGILRTAQGWENGVGGR